MGNRMFEAGVGVVSRDHKYSGVTTGSTHKCRMEGCLGLRVSVRWSDGKITYPCSKGMQVMSDGRWHIM